MMPSRNLRWALLLTVAATVWAAMQPESEQLVDVPAATSRRAAPVEGTTRAITRATSPATGQAATGSPASAGNPPTQADLTLRAGWPAAPAANRDPGLALAAPAALAAWQPLPLPPSPPVSPVIAAMAPPAALPPPPPAFPYTLIGRVEDGGQVQVLLSSPLRTISARVDDLVDGQWRLDAIQPGGAVFVWVSGGQRQTVSYRPS